MEKKLKVLELIKAFDQLYPTAECSLKYEDPLQLLIATQLSAQCTDARVNIVTRTLFQKYKNVVDFANADLAELEQDIKSTGFYHNKAKNIKGCCQRLIEIHDGKVPGRMEDLLKLPGVGRKTANLVLGDIFGVPGIVVDTHAKRLSNRLGLSQQSDPEKIEYDLMEVVPESQWSRLCHQLVYHGRAVCDARKPRCAECSVRAFCDYGQQKKTVSEETQNM